MSTSYWYLASVRFSVKISSNMLGFEVGYFSTGNCTFLIDPTLKNLIDEIYTRLYLLEFCRSTECRILSSGWSSLHPTWKQFVSLQEKSTHNRGGNKNLMCELNQWIPNMLDMCGMSHRIYQMSGRGIHLNLIKCPTENPKCLAELKSFWQSLELWLCMIYGCNLSSPDPASFKFSGQKKKFKSSTLSDLYNAPDAVISARMRR